MVEGTRNWLEQESWLLREIPGVPSSVPLTMGVAIHGNKLVALI